MNETTENLYKEVDIRRNKIETLKAQGINPYPELKKQKKKNLAFIHQVQKVSGFKKEILL